MVSLLGTGFSFGAFNIDRIALFSELLRSTEEYSMFPMMAVPLILALIWSEMVFRGISF